MTGVTCLDFNISGCFDRIHSKYEPAIQLLSLRVEKVHYNRQNLLLPHDRGARLAGVLM